MFFFRKKEIHSINDTEHEKIMRKINTVSLTHTVIGLIGYVGIVSWMIASKIILGITLQGHLGVCK